MLKTKQYHGGQEVFSKKHNKNIHILMAHHTGDKIDYYMMVDGTKVKPDEVEGKHYRYRISAYTSESTTFEGIAWTSASHHDSDDKEEILRRFNQLSATALKDKRNIMRFSQARKTEEQALSSRETSMRSETWECYSENGSRYWYRITMYVLIPSTY